MSNKRGNAIREMQEKWEQGRRAEGPNGSAQERQRVCRSAAEHLTENSEEEMLNLEELWQTEGGTCTNKTMRANLGNSAN